MKNQIISESTEDTLQFAKKFASNLKGGEKIGLKGELGAGKTVFVRGIAEGLKVDDTRLVGSPTFKIINVYEGKFTIYHIDLYRLNSIEEILDLGLFDLEDDNTIQLIEWADKMSTFEYDFDYFIEISYLGEHKRKITANRMTEKGKQ